MHRKCGIQERERCGKERVRVCGGSAGGGGIKGSTFNICSLRLWRKRREVMSSVCDVQR